MSGLRLAPKPRKEPTVSRSTPARRETDIPKRRTRPDRRVYLDAGYTEEVFEDADAVVYTKTEPDRFTPGRERYLVVLYSGTKVIPDIDGSFTVQHWRDERIAYHLDLLRQKVADRKAAKVPSTLKPGDILHGSWGYEQTNPEFYVVLDVLGPHTVLVQELRFVGVGDPAQAQQAMSDRVIPTDEFAAGSQPIKKRVQYGNRIAFDHFNLRPWDGTPQTHTWYG